MDYSANNLNLIALDGSSPNHLKQILVSDGLTASQGKNPEHFKFLWSKIDALSPHGNESRFEINAKIMSVDYFRSLMTETPEQDSDSGQEFLHPERFNHVIVSSSIERQNFVAFCV